MTERGLVKKIEEKGSWLVSLYYRWESEKKYEDWSDYVEVIKRSIPHVNKVSKSFKITFNEIVKGYRLCVKLKPRGDTMIFTISKERL